jgi:hypothetical protein
MGESVTDYIEDLLEVKQWRAGYEFRHQDRWLKILSFTVQSDAVNVVVNTYDPLEGRKRTFSMETGHMHRTRRSREVALQESWHPLERIKAEGVA